MSKAILIFLLIALYGCDQQTEAPPPTQAEANNPNIGVVIETINVQSYTYTRLVMAEREIWIASTPIQLSPGDMVRFSGEMTMNDFYSKELDRTFSEVLFVSSAAPIGAGASNTPIGQAAPQQLADPHQGMNIQAASNTGPAVQETIVVQALEGGMTIAKIFAEFEQLEGKEVSLRAKVTKLSPNILGKNWITLQDGTGTAPDNALVVTTSELADLGDELVVKGRVKSNVDIGGGYNYKVLLEDASFSQ